MKTSTAVIWVIILVLIIIGGIYWYRSANSYTTAPAATQGATSVLALGTNSQFSNYLTASNGMTLYTYNNDTPGVSNCSGACATNWPPYTVAMGTVLSPAANIPGTIATITRSDGTMQVTYNGMPLYFWNGDTNPGDATGNGQDNFTITTVGQTSGQSSGSSTPMTQTQAAPMQPAPAPSGY